MKQAKKYVLIGCGGSGKSTLARKLQKRTGFKMYELDSVRFEGGFTGRKKEPAEFIDDIRSIATQDSWIAEGMYYKHGVDKELWNKADVVVWLDMPYSIIARRVWHRSLRRLIKGRHETTGAKITPLTEFGRSGILRHLRKIYIAVQTHYPPLLTDLDGRNILVLKSNKDIDRFLNSV